MKVARIPGKLISLAESRWETAETVSVYGAIVRNQLCTWLLIYALHYGVKRTETHFGLSLNLILGQKVANEKSRGKYK